MKLIPFLNNLTRHDNLSLLHLNIKSLRSNLDDFHNLLEESKHPFNVICSTETWFNDHEFIDTSLKKEIIKTSISDLFAIFANFQIKKLKIKK